MKVYLCVDMEGIAGITDWDEADKDKRDYAEFREILTGEVVAACEAAHDAGAREVWVRDGHWTGRNILLEPLPPYVKIVRAWNGHPQEVLLGLDKSFAALAFIGFHCRAGSESHPLAHTITTKIMSMTVNDIPASEMLIHAWSAAQLGVPLCFISGDREICNEAKALIPAINTAEISQGLGRSTISLSPQGARTLIKDRLHGALQDKNLGECFASLPSAFDVRIEYNDPIHAYKFQWYPGAKHIGDRTIQFQTKDFFEVLRFLHFVT